jgi:hypothetical protein
MRRGMNSQAPTKKIASTTNYLDPEFVAEIQAEARSFDMHQSEVDDSKWNIAAKVNAMWDEHKAIMYEMSDQRVFETKAEYYIACSFAANVGLKHKRFGDSGETLRRWCELQETYAQFEHAELFLDVLSLEHLRVAKMVSRKLEKEQAKVISPVVMLARAVSEKWNSEEMQEHYNPFLATPPYDAMRGRLATLQDRNYYPFLKKREDVDFCIARAREIDERIRQAIQAEGKAT